MFPLILVACLAQANSFTELDIPYSLLSGSATESIRRDFQVGEVSFVSRDRAVIIRWSAYASANQPPVYPTPTVVDLQHNALNGEQWDEKDQAFPIRFFPTECCILDDSSFVVGGVNSNGKTVIERWNLSWPSGQVGGPLVDIETGLLVVNVVLPVLQSRDRLYTGDETGKNLVRNLSALRRSSGAPSEVLVQFHDSNDVYRFSLASSQFTLLASSTSGQGELGVIATLADPVQNTIAYGDRTGVGYTYRFIVGQSDIVSSTPFSTLIFTDSDRNGTIDSQQSVSFAGYFAQGWALSSNYTEWWLD